MRLLYLPSCQIFTVCSTSQLRKHVPDLSQVLEVDEVQVREDLSIDAKPIRIKDFHTK